MLRDAAQCTPPGRARLEYTARSTVSPRSRYHKLSRVPGNAGLVAAFSRPESQGSGVMALGRSPSMCEYAAESWETGGPELSPLIRLRCCRKGACSTPAYRVSALLSALWTLRCPSGDMVVAVHVACEVENMERASQPGRYGVCLRHRSPLHYMRIRSSRLDLPDLELKVASGR